ncbi:hypothetical protein SHKM778_95410 (plasmid) [Streptomyces sp. KM77-8]|uniref:Uncharacterized protein n=1 Tax=Streptomyces haneummycinicus TaxID=3074435 RepID=A0AAT9I0F8_9ACTN
MVAEPRDSVDEALPVGAALRTFMGWAAIHAVRAGSLVAVAAWRAWNRSASAVVCSRVTSWCRVSTQIRMGIVFVGVLLCPPMVLVWIRMWGWWCAAQDCAHSRALL